MSFTLYLVQLHWEAAVRHGVQDHRPSGDVVLRSAVHEQAGLV